MRNIRAILAFSLLPVSIGFGAVPYAGSDADDGISRPSGLLNFYTGNAAFSTRDLVVAGSVGRVGLAWRRYATSRPTQTGNHFGLGHNWAHSWQWEMTTGAVNDQGRSVVVIREPRGTVHRFTEVAAGIWQAGPADKDRLVADGDKFTLRQSEAGNVHFLRQATKRGPVFALTAVEDEIGNVWRLTYEGGNLAQITEPAGRWLKIEYQTLVSAGAKSAVVIRRVSASDGQAVEYTYNFPAGTDYPVLAGAGYPDGTSSTYTYACPRPGDRWLLTEADDPRSSRAVRGLKLVYRTEPEAAWGQIHEIRAADSNRVIWAIEADEAQPGGRSYVVTLDNGSTIYRTYNPGGNLAREIDALGFVTKWDYDAGGRGLKIAETNALGHVTRFEYDANRRGSRTIFPDGTSKQWKRDDSGRILAETDELGNVRRFTYDAKGRRIGVQYPDGATDETSYNELGQPLTFRDRGGAITSYRYDKRGLRIGMTSALGATYDIVYDKGDRIAAITDPRGNTTRYERDAGGRVTRTTFADGSAKTVQYNRFGQVTRRVDATGVVQDTEYDQFGRTVAHGDSLGQLSRLEYAPVGSKGRINRPINAISASGRITTTTYDAKGRTQSRTVDAGSSASATFRMSHDAADRLISMTNPAGKTVQFAYDQRGRRVKTTTALNHTATTDYDAAGRKLSATDAKGNTTRWTYDSMGRVLTKTDAKGQVTRREYDPVGRLVAITDANLNTHRFEYDPRGRLTALIYPDGSRETSEYDVAGLRVRYTNRAGVVQTFKYDNRNREILSEWSDGSQRIVKQYDAAGRLASEDNGISKITFAYDENGRVRSESQDLSLAVTEGALDPAARTVSYTYNADGQRESLRYPDGDTVNFVYNGQGKLTSVMGEEEQPIASYEYDLAGNATHMPRENDTETEQEYDAENKPTTVVDRAADARAPLSRKEYQYDEVGNPTLTVTETNATGQGTTKATAERYLYDETYQVTGADYAAPVHGDAIEAPEVAVRFRYDSVGNRLQVDANGKTTRYAANKLNQYIKVGEFLPAYDGNGNLASMGRWIYRYDALNRLVFATNGTTTAKFYYDPRNRCVARSFNGETTLYTYANWNVVEERDAQGKPFAQYSYGRQMDEMVMMANRHGVYYPHHDARGNVTMLTDAKGQVVERYSYTVEGKVTIMTPNGQVLPSSAVGNRWMYRGREWLADLELYDYRNRVYSAELGRFLQTDKVRFAAQDVNLYRYCFNRYARGADPYGTGWIDDLTNGISDLIDDGVGAVNSFIDSAIDTVEAGMEEVLDGMQAAVDFELDLLEATVDLIQTGIEYEFMFIDAYVEVGYEIIDDAIDIGSDILAEKIEDAVDSWNNGDPYSIYDLADTAMDLLDICVTAALIDGIALGDAYYDNVIDDIIDWYYE